MLKIKLKVIPGAAKTGISGWLGDRLRVRVSAPPEKGRANKEVIALLSEKLGVPARLLEISSGRNSPLKVVEISGLSENEVLAKIQNLEMS